jgi:uncharacterized protein YkwD
VKYLTPEQVLFIHSRLIDITGGSLLLIAVLLFLVSPSYAKDIRPRINTVELEIRIHELINIERHKAGLKPLTLDKKLSAIARGHSQDMAKKNYFSHISPEGEDFLARYKKKGFVCQMHVGQHIYEGAENIFLDNLYSSVTYTDGRAHYDWNSLEEIARSIVKGWMKSDGHRENILQPPFRSQGIGVVIKDGKVYITENFC